MIKKMESLIFKQSLGYCLVQLVNNRTVLISNRCSIKQFTETGCHIIVPNGRYEISGQNLRVAEYGDDFVRIESDLIKCIAYEKGGSPDE
ncbi:MAG: YabP/YqfC family sporulation protein [Turicibacter sp.]|nr:YabP/YqfC family sporulation protein [Turicibacter sp.]